MNKLKVLLIAGLLSLTSVSFATSITASGTGIGAAGTITLVDDGVNVELAGPLAAAGTSYVDGLTFATVTDSVFYEVTTANNDGFAAGFSTQNLLNYDLTYTLYDAYDAVLGLIAANAVDTNVNSIVLGPLVDGATYYLELSNLNDLNIGYGVTVSAVPVPAAGILFASALLGAGAFGRRKKKQASVVGAFARAS